MRSALLTLAGAVVSVLAFPPFGPGLLIVIGVALFLAGLASARDRRHGLGLGALYGFAFFGGLMWWLSELGLIAVIPLVVVLTGFPAAYGWWLTGFNDRSPGVWLTLAVGGWAVMELIRYHFPFGGLEWGGAGYALSDNLLTRLPAATVGTSGLTVSVVLVAGLLALGVNRRFEYRLTRAFPIILAVVAVSPFPFFGKTPTATQSQVAIVQGSTPCPYEHCPDERRQTYEQHLELTRQIEPGDLTLVVWSEGSTGAFNADPVLNAEVRDAIGAEARRLGVWMLVGGDRPLSETDWVNANVIFDPSGAIVGEYRKQHPVPFGEYIPFRPLFEWIPALDQVPRDMIPGDGAVVFDTGGFKLGSVISFEGAFARYARQHRLAGAEMIVVATNEGSYGTTPASDQFISMTRMRAMELGVPVVHAAVTGKSTVISPVGELSEVTGLATREILFAPHWVPITLTPYTRIGDLLMYLAAVVGLIVWWRSRTPA